MFSRIKLIWNAHRHMPFGLKWLYNSSLFLAFIIGLFGFITVTGGGAGYTEAGLPVTDHQRIRTGFTFILIAILALASCDATARKLWWARVGLGLTGSLGTTLLVASNVSTWIAIVILLVIIAFVFRYLFQNKEVVDYFRNYGNS